MARKWFGGWVGRTKTVQAGVGDVRGRGVGKGWTNGGIFNMVPVVPDVRALTWDQALRG